MAEKDSTERRVYNLPADLLERLRAYQVNQGISSEVEAARRLLDNALQMRDTVEDILNTLESKFAEERDLRVLAADILVRHALVTDVSISDSEVSFSLKTGYRGKISSGGSLYYATPDDHEEYWASYIKRSQKQPARKSWEATAAAPAGAGGDIDDEIPF